jgi:energy-converting hydrogenase Eha subunit A
MFTTLDKALVATLGGLIFIVNNFTGFHFGIDEATLNAIVGVLVPLLTYFVPNKPVQ